MRIIDVDTGDLMLEVEYIISDGDESVGVKPSVEFWAYLLDEDFDFDGIIRKQGDDVTAYLSFKQEQEVIKACFEDEKRWKDDWMIDA